MTTIPMLSKTARTGNLVLVNESHPCDELAEGRDLVPADDPTLPACGPGGRAACKTLLARTAAASLNLLVRAAGGWGPIVPVSGWRSQKEQQRIWDGAVRDRGLAFARSYVARPGCSEHQTGLAIDLGCPGPDGEEPDFICPDFPYEGAAQAFRKQAASYGFVERYPAGKEDVTSVAHEPWHFRYVGRPHAALMAERGLVLEEYLALLDGFDRYDRALHWAAPNGGAYAIWRVSAADAGPVVEIDLDGCKGAGMPCSVSGDNRGGFVVTVRTA